MLFTFFHTALFFAFGAYHVAASDLQLDTPTLTQCQNASLSYSGGQGHYSLYVVPSEEPCADSVVDIPEQRGTQYNWLVNIPAGSKVEIMVEDSTGTEAWSGPVTVQTSTDTTCIDPKAVQALNAANGASTASSSAASSGGAPTTTPNSPTASGSSTAVPAVKTVSPATVPAGAANAIGGANIPPSSGSIPRVALPAGSLIAAAVFILTLGHY